MSELDKYQVVSASLHHILFPLIEEVVQGDEQLERQLKLAFTKTEYTGNGFAHDFINGVIHFLKKIGNFHSIRLSNILPIMSCLTTQP